MSVWHDMVDRSPYRCCPGHLADSIRWRYVMQPPYRLRDGCLACDGRGHIYVGGQDDELLCPACSPWCSLCLAGATSPFVMSQPRLGDLVAGVCLDAIGDPLFCGYACDFHKVTLRSYSFIAPWMLDPARFQLGTAYIIVQGRRAFVVLYGYGEAANWPTLEADSWHTIRAQGGVRFDGGLGFAACPPELGARAALPAWPAPTNGRSNPT